VKIFFFKSLTAENSSLMKVAKKELIELAQCDFNGTIEVMPNIYPVSSSSNYPFFQDRLLEL
jgi:hypothetical protein